MDGWVWINISLGCWEEPFLSSQTFNERMKGRERKRKCESGTKLGDYDHDMFYILLLRKKCDKHIPIIYQEFFCL